MAGITAADVGTYIGQLKSRKATKKSLFAAAASGDTTIIEATTPGGSRRYVITELTIGVDTAGETLLVEDEDGLDLVTFYFPVADTYVFRNLTIEITPEKGFKLDKGTVAAIRGWVTYHDIEAGDPVSEF